MIDAGEWRRRADLKRCIEAKPHGQETIASDRFRGKSIASAKWLVTECDRFSPGFGTKPEHFLERYF